ncbi:MAG TPA: polymer-forming cytoskeletal protein [Pyrinomonadaceae bacterium]|nr:polymer-forming cytoskeletal protein [Pyrinomonadaceae bacterium]
MIRMGRSSGKEQTNEVNNNEQSSSYYQYTSETQPSSTRAISESESMARDIKEGRLSGFVGNGTVLTGETNFQAMLRVDGHLTGRVTSENGTLIIGATGKVDANIAVAAALVNGTVNGDIIATEKIEFGRTARVTGNIQTPRLVIEDGAVLEGSCSMTKARQTAEKRHTESRRVEETFQEPILEEVLETEDEETAEAAAN